MFPVCQKSDVFRQRGLINRKSMSWNLWIRSWGLAVVVDSSSTGPISTGRKAIASCYKVITGQVLLGPKATPVHETHELWFWAGIFYCRKCGAFGNHRTVLLGSQCKLVPSRAGAAALKKLDKGLSPSPYIEVVGNTSVRPLKVVRALPQRR